MKINQNNPNPGSTPPQAANGLTARKLIRRHRYHVAAALTLTVIVILSLMFFHTPRTYKPLQPPRDRQVSLYFTNRIAPEFFNKTQLDEPFDLLIEQHGFNEILADGSVFGWKWPVKLSGATFSAPAAAFTPYRLSLMATIRWARIPIVVTINAAPAIDDKGRLTLNLKRFKAGALDVTPAAKRIAAKIIADQLQNANSDSDTAWLTGLRDAISKNAPFDPIFPSYNNRSVRLTAVNITESKLTLTFQPE